MHLLKGTHLRMHTNEIFCTRAIAITVYNSSSIFKMLSNVFGPPQMVKKFNMSL